MKNLTLSLASAFVAVLGFAGKTTAQSQPRFGIKAGLAYTTLGSATQGGISVNYDYRPGFQGGVFAEIPISDIISINPQVLFTQKGGNIDRTFDLGSLGSARVKGSVQLNYIDVPVLFGVKANPKLSFYAGPQVSFLLSYKATATSGGNTITDTNKDDIQSTVIGGNLGAGYQICDNFGVNLNYISDFGKAGRGAKDDGEKNSGFILSFGYKF